MKKRILPLLLSFALLLSSCSVPTEKKESRKDSDDPSPQISAPVAVDLSAIPPYNSSPFVIIGDNTPRFTEDEITEKSFEAYSSLDALGRCGVTLACIGMDLMPTEERGAIGQIKPSGWHTVKYEIVDGKYLYNRCHLIGFQLTGENANERNLITGTRYLNVEGMLPFENMVADYIKETGNHVMYRVTPVFEGEKLLCSGVLMEAYSVEDRGEGICFYVYCYNVQPGIHIDYATGESSLAPSASQGKEESGSFVLNTNSKKIHKPHCPSVDDMLPKNRQDYKGSLDVILAQGYEKCKSCFT